MRKFTKKLTCCLLTAAILSSATALPGFAKEWRFLPAAAEQSLPSRDTPIPESAVRSKKAAPGDILLAETLPEETVSGSHGDNLIWSLTPEGALTITGTGKMAELAAYNYSQYPWYPYARDIVSVEIGEGVTSIAQCAFYSRYLKLASVSLPSTLTSIGSSAFAGSALTSMTIPDRVTTVAGQAFSGCTALISVSIGDGLSRLGSNCFADCTSLETVEIGKGLNSYTDTDNTFFNCSSLKRFIVDPSNTIFSSDSFGILYNANKTELILAPVMFSAEGYTIPASVETIRDFAFWLNRSVAELVIPATVDTIGTGAFGQSHIQSVSLHCRQVGKNAFARCDSLTEVEIGPEAELFHDGVFSACTALEEITVPATLKAPGAQTFDGCTGLKYATLCEGLTGLGSHMFRECESLKEITIPSSVTALPQGCFYGALALSRVTLPETMTYIGSESFYNCRSLSHIDLPDAVTVIDKGAFHGSSLLAITLPARLTTIADSAFYQTHLTQVDFPDGLISIGDDAFGYADFTSIRLPDSLTDLGEGVFQNCSELRSIAIPEGITTIGEYLFDKCESLRSVKLPQSLRTIEAYAFRNCTVLTSITIPEHVTTLTRYAFRNCENLKSVIFEGPAPEVVGTGIFPGTAMLYYFINQAHTGWSTPTWNGYNASPILGSSREFHDGNYYAQLAQRSFSFLQYSSTGGDQPVYGVTLTHGGSSVTSSDTEHRITAAISSGLGEYLTFTREGMKTAVLPVAVLSSLNTIHLHPETETGPFIQSVYARHVYDNKNSPWCDLLHSGITFRASHLSSKAELYVDVNWNGTEEGTIWLSQYSDGSDGWKLDNGFNLPEHYAVLLKYGLPLYLVVKSGDEVVCSKRLKTTILQPKMNVPMDLAPDIDIDSVQLDLFAGFEFGIDLPGDANITLTVESDGTVKALLGVTVVQDDPKNATTIYDHVKKSLLEEMSAESFTGLQNMLKERGAVLEAPKSSKLVVDAEVEMIGFLEGRLVQQFNGDYGLMFSEGAVAVKLGGKVAYTYQVMAPTTPPIPFYIKGSFEPSAQFTLPLYSHPRTGIIQAGKVLLDIELPLKVGGGVGFDEILSVGIFGKGGAYLSGHLGETDADVWLEAHFGAEASVFCFNADLKIAETDRLYLLGQPDARSFRLSPKSLLEAEWTVQSRNYLSAPALDHTQLFAVSEENTMITAGAVTAAPVYAGTDVQTAPLPDGTLLAVWTEDDPSRDAANRTVLHFSFYDGSSWSEPSAVETEDCADNTADFSPFLRVLNGSAYLAWQNADRPITGEDTIADVSGLIDIRCMKFDASEKKFHNIGCSSVGTEYYDSTFDLVLRDGTVEIIWVSNSANQVFAGDEPTYSIHRHALSAEGQAETLAEGLCYVDGLASDGETIWFTADTDGNSETLEDRELFALTDTLTQLTDNSVADTKPFIAGGQLAWYSDGAVHIGEQKIPAAVWTDRFHYLATAGMEAVLYAEDDENRLTTLYASFNDGSGWGAPMVLVEAGSHIVDYAPCFLPDGTLFVVMAVRIMDEEGGLSEAAHLQTYAVTPYCDLVVTKVDYLPQSMVSGGTLDITVDVTNRGMSTVQLIDLSVFSGEELLVSGVYTAELFPGTSEQLQLSVPLGETLSDMGGLTVTAEAVSFTDALPEDNTGSLTLRLSDLSAEAAEAHSDGRTTTATVLVVNRGQTDLSNITVELLDTDGETVLATEKAASLAVGEGQYLSLTAEKGCDHLSILTIRTSVDGLDPREENVSSNNSRTVIADGVKEPVFDVIGSAAATEEGAVAVMELVNTTGRETACSIAVAAYDADGRLLDVSYVDYTIPSGSRIPVTVRLTTEKEPTEVRIFVLDNDLIPVSQAKILPLT